MSEEWFIRVEGKEYGPVNLETLREWKTEGRLIPENDVRKVGESSWVLAGSVDEIFPRGETAAGQSNESVRRRGFGEIIAETFRIYRIGLPQFFLLALLVGLPSLGLKLSLAFIHIRPDEPLTEVERIAGAIAIVMIVAILAIWPIFLGGLQFATAELAASRPIRLREILRRAINLWPRMARLCCFVYGSFLFWIALPLLAVLTLAATPSIVSLLVALLALAFQVYMAGRLFINFMFWQQAATLGQLEGIEALRESKELARSRPNLPRLQRPLYRGAILASIWLVILIVVSAAVELPFYFVRLQGITSIEQGVAIMQALVNAPVPDTMTVVADVLSSLVHAALRPLLGIAFVVLYLDAKATRSP